MSIQQPAYKGSHTLYVTCHITRDTGFPPFSSLPYEHHKTSHSGHEG